MNNISAYPDAKKHYEVLDGLRGVAAIMVVSFHVFETFAGGNRLVQVINHGYLAVDFFFLLSGFVVAYAYDDRWGRMTQWEFYKRRLIRLQPMVIMGSVVGALLYYFQAGEVFPLISQTPVWKMLLVMLVGCTLLPLPTGMDIRGWQEMHPLNGPAWSLFFEYIANISYALFVRRFSKILLAFFVALFAGLLIHYTTASGTRGDLIGGWALDPAQLNVGFTRLLYPFFAGVLLCRMQKLVHVKASFWICSAMIITVLCIPRIGGAGHLWMNGLYESFCVIIIFPVIVAIGAGGHLEGKYSTRICKFLGGISYPLYITHYPLIYTYVAWVTKNNVPLERGLPVGLLLLIAGVSIAYVCLKYYDEPLRNWLTKRFLVKR